MKAGFGITYQENSHREVGPSYHEKPTAPGQASLKGRLSREQYTSLFSGNQSLKNRARDLLAKQKQLLESSTLNEESSGLRKTETLKRTRAESLRQSRKDEPDVTSSQLNLKGLRGSSIGGDYGGLGGTQMMTHTSQPAFTTKDRSLIKVHSKKANRDLLVKKSPVEAALGATTGKHK